MHFQTLSYHVITWKRENFWLNAPLVPFPFSKEATHLIHSLRALTPNTRSRRGVRRRLIITNWLKSELARKASCLQMKQECCRMDTSWSESPPAQGSSNATAGKLRELGGREREPAGQRPAGEEGLCNRFGCGLYLQQRIKIGKGNGDKRKRLDLRWKHWVKPQFRDDGGQIRDLNRTYCALCVSRLTRDLTSDCPKGNQRQKRRTLMMTCKKPLSLRLQS